MKVAVAFTALLVLAVGVRANVYVPKAKLAGETVSVLLSKESASVSGAYQFEEWQTRDEKIAYFPIYSSDKDAIRALSDSRFEFRIGDKAGTAMPCAAPRSYSAPPSGIYVHWYCIRFDDLTEIEDTDQSVPPTIIHVSYTQPLIGGRFFYLPVIPAQDVPSGQRAWSFQLHARSAVRRIGVQSKCDHELIGDSVTVYLRDDRPVVLE